MKTMMYLGKMSGSPVQYLKAAVCSGLDRVSVLSQACNHSLNTQAQILCEAFESVLEHTSGWCYILTRVLDWEENSNSQNKFVVAYCCKKNNGSKSRETEKAQANIEKGGSVQCWIKGDLEWNALLNTEDVQQAWKNHHTLAQLHLKPTGVCQQQ